MLGNHFSYEKLQPFFWQCTVHAVQCMLSTSLFFVTSSRTHLCSRNGYLAIRGHQFGRPCFGIPSFCHRINCTMSSFWSCGCWACCLLLKNKWKSTTNVCIQLGTNNYSGLSKSRGLEHLFAAVILDFAD